MLTNRPIRLVNYYINHSMEQPILKVENLSHRYSVQWAIRDINFEITQNGVYGLLGSNGAGKSTTMNIICGVLKQTEGNVSIKGVDAGESRRGKTAYRIFTSKASFTHGSDGRGILDL